MYFVKNYFKTSSVPISYGKHKTVNIKFIADISLKRLGLTVPTSLMLTHHTQGYRRC